MTAIDMPTTPGFTTSRFYLETNTQTFESPLTKDTQRMVLGGSRWVGSYSLPPMHRAQAAAWQAFLLKLQGRANTFNAYDPDKKSPLGAATGTPLVNGANQTGSTIITADWGHSITALKAGDMFSFGELKMATADAITDSSGNVTISFQPPIRTSPADNTPIVTYKPTCTMILTDDAQASWDCDKNGIYQAKTFTAAEVF